MTYVHDHNLVFSVWCVPYIDYKVILVKGFEAGRKRVWLNGEDARFLLVKLGSLRGALQVGKIHRFTKL